MPLLLLIQHGRNDHPNKHEDRINRFQNQVVVAPSRSTRQGQSKFAINN
jgi:hypothetical protein